MRILSAIWSIVNSGTSVVILKELQPDFSINKN